MADTKYARQYQERLEADRQRAREEARRREALERRQAEELERQRREEHRRETMAQARELEASLEAAHQQRETAIAQLRSKLKTERRETERQVKQRNLILETLGEAAHRARQEEQQKAERQTRYHEAAEQARREEQRKTARTAQTETEHIPRGEQIQPKRGSVRPASDEVSTATPEAKQRRPRGTAFREAMKPRQQAKTKDTRRQTNRLRRTKARQPQPARTPATAGGPLLPSKQEIETKIEKRIQAPPTPPGKPAKWEAETRGAKHQARLKELKLTDRLAKRVQALRQTQRLKEQESQKQADQRLRLRAGRSGRAALPETARAPATQQPEKPRQPGMHAEKTSSRHGKTRPSPPARARPVPTRNPLETRIPSGVLSGSLPWLRVDGNQMTTLDGVRVVLHGISLFGLDSAPPDPSGGFAAGSGITDTTIDTILDWGATIIRLAINRDRVLKGCGGWSGQDYLNTLDQIIRRAADRGAYTLLSLRRLDEDTVFGTLPGSNGARVANFVAPMPDFDSVRMWRLLGERYADEPSVLYDLYSSPHAPLSDDWSGIDARWDNWTMWVRLAIAELRQRHPRALCFVSGLDWATEFSGFPIRWIADEAIPNVVYAAHLARRQAGVQTALSALSRRHPVFVTEWGGEHQDVGWGIRTALALSAWGVGWTAGPWNGEPSLVRTAGRRQEHTPFGAVIRRVLELEREPFGDYTAISPMVLMV